MGRRKSIPKWVRDAMPKRCCFCGTTNDIQFDHIKPEDNDTWTIENTRPLCNRCHHLITHGQMIVGQGEILRDHGFLVREGIARAKAKGKRLGKPPADYEKVMRLISEWSTQFNPESLTTEHEIMAMGGVKEVCYAKCKRMLIDAVHADVWPYDWPKPEQVLNRPLYDGAIKKLRGDAV